MATPPIYFYGVIIDQALDGVRQHLAALAKAAEAELGAAGGHAETEEALDRLRQAIEALRG